MKKDLLPIPALLYEEQNYCSESSPSITIHASENLEVKLGIRLSIGLKTHTFS